MKAIILCGTLRPQGHSNTIALCHFFAQYLQAQQVECEVIRLAAHRIVAGTESDLGIADDAWPQILPRLLDADIIVFATPVWWGGHSSEIQKVIERMDALHDKLMKGETSGLERKAGGIIITGDSDGAQHIIGNIANFFNAIGLHLPPFAALSVLASEQAKGKHPSEAQLLQLYREKYDKPARTMADALVRTVRALQPAD